MPSSGFPATPDAFDITIDDIGTMMYRDPAFPKQFTGGFTSSVLGEELQHRDVPIEQSDWSAGFGHSVNIGIGNGYAYGENVCTRIPGAVVPAGYLEQVTWIYGSAVPTCHAEYGNDLYLFTGEGYILKCANKTDAPALVAFFTGYSFTSAVVFDGKVYAAGWDGVVVKDIVEFDGTTWAALAGIPAYRVATVTWFTVDNVPSMRLVRLDTTTSLKHLASGATASVAGNWSSATKIGDTTFNVNKLVASDQHLYALRPDGAHDIEAFGQSPNITPYWDDTADTVSGQCGVIYEGRLVASHIMGLDAIELKGDRRDKPVWCHPGYNLNNETPISGRITAMTVESGWLVVAVSNPTNGNSYIMYGRFKEDLGLYDFPAPIVWHGAEAVITGSASAARYVTHMHVISPPADEERGLLYIYSTDGTSAHFHKLSLPRGGTALSDWAVGGAHRFSENATIHLTRQTWGSPSSKKFLWRYEVEAENIGGSRLLMIYADRDMAGYVLQGQMAESPRVKFNAQSTGPSHIIGHKIVGQCSQEQPWILRSIRVRAEVAVEQSDVRTYDIVFGSGISLRGNYGIDERDPQYILSLILALQDSEPVSIIDQWGRVMVGRVLQGITYDAKEEQADHWFVRAQIRVRILSYQGVYDLNGDRYDTDVTYSEAA